MKVDGFRERNLPIAWSFPRSRRTRSNHSVRLDRDFVGVGADDTVEIDALGEQFERVVLERIDLVKLDLGALADLFGGEAAFSRAFFSRFPRSCSSSCGFLAIVLHVTDAISRQCSCGYTFSRVRCRTAG